MNDDLTDFWIHTVQIETRLGRDEDGADTYADPAPVVGFLEETSRIVRTADGAQVVSSAQLFAPADTAAALDSRVTLPNGRATQVLSIEKHLSGDLDLPDHIVLNLE